MTGDGNVDDYYVYRHVDTSTGEIVYVGKGRADRAWSVRSLSSRQPDHIEWFKDQNPFECVQCVAHGLSSDTALSVEKEEISNTSPKFNKRKAPSDYKSHNQKLTEDDAFIIKYMFLPTAVKNGDIADLFGITKGAVSQIKHNKIWRNV
jgi:hypothetical protein